MGVSNSIFSCIDLLFLFVCSSSSISNQDLRTRKVEHVLVQMARLREDLLIDLHLHHIIWEDPCLVVLQLEARPNTVRLPWGDLLTRWEDPHRT